MRRDWLLVGLLASIACETDVRGKQPGATPPADWVAVTPPTPGTWEERCANWAREEYGVSLSTDSSTLIVSGPPPQQLADTLTTEAGHFILRRRREGGEVWFETAARDSQLIAEVPLEALVATGQGIYGVVGWAHLPLRGAIVRFERGNDGAWSMQPLMELESPAQAVHRLPDDTLLVITLEGQLLEVRPPAYVRKLHWEPLWNATYPNSIARDRSGAIFVGMRSAVARLAPSDTGYDVAWLVPASCPKRQVAPGLANCACVVESRSD